MPSAGNPVPAPTAANPSKGKNMISPAIGEVHQEPGCQLYAVHEVPNGQIVMIEKWDSSELLDAHGDGAAVERLNASLEGLLEEPVEVTRLVPIAAGTAHQGML